MFASLGVDNVKVTIKAHGGKKALCGVMCDTTDCACRAFYTTWRVINRINIRFGTGEWEWENIVNK